MEYNVKHNKTLDGLRGIAALNVAILHYITAFFPSIAHNIYPNQYPLPLVESNLYKILTFPLLQVIYNGSLAVMVFFVLSGYVMTIPFYRNNIDVLKVRIWSRYFRLNIPIFFAVMISFFVYKYNLYYAVEAGSSGGAEWLKHTFAPSAEKEVYSLYDAVKSALYRSILYGDSTYIEVLWTLYYEFIGSLLLMFLYLSIPKRNIILVSIVVSLLLWLTFKQKSVFFLAIYAGSLLPYVNNKKRFGYTFLFLGLYFGCFTSGFKIYDVLPRPSVLGHQVFELYSFYRAIGATFLVTAVLNGVGHRMLCSRFAQFLGEISYSLYLLHFIILLSVTCFIFTVLPRSNISDMLIFIVYLGSTLSLSFLFANIIDKPAVAISHVIPRWIGVVE